MIILKQSPRGLKITQDKIMIIITDAGCFLYHFYDTELNADDLGRNKTINNKKYFLFTELTLLKIHMATKNMNPYHNLETYPGSVT